MNVNTSRTPTSTTAERKRRPLPPGYRVLHVTVPEEVFNAAKAQALLSGIDWPQFVIELLRQADPRTGDVLPRHIGLTPTTK